MSQNIKYDPKNLEQIKEQFEKRKNEAIAELEEAKRNKQNRDANLEAISSAISEITKIVDAYGKVLPELRSNMDDKQKYHHKKKPMIDTAVSGKEKEIEKIINECSTQINDLEQEKTKLEREKNLSEKELNTATQSLAEKNKKYNQYKNQQKAIKDDLKKLKELRDQIENEETECEFALMYYLLNKDYEPIMDEIRPKLIEKESFKNKLAELWVNIQESKDTVREKEVRFNELKKSYIEKESELNKANEDLKGKILQRLRDEIDLFETTTK